MTRVVLEVDLHDAQTAIHESDARFRVVSAGRRFGKTRLASLEALETGLDGGRVWWVAPTYPMAMEGWRPLRLMAQEIPGAAVREVDKEIRLPGGGLIQIRSADRPDRLRGAGLDLLIMDEAAYCDQQAWEQALRPSLSDRQGRALFISTPQGMNWFHDLWKKAATQNGWAQFQFPSIANPFFPPDELDMAKADLPSLVILQEYEAQFVEQQGSRYKPAWFRYYTLRTRDDGVRFLVTDDGEIDLRETTRYGTVDLAASTKSHADYTVIASVAQHDGNLFVLEVDRARREGPDIIPAIQTAIDRYDLGWVGIEKQGFQLALVQFARRENLPVRELTPDRDKIGRSLALEARMESGNVFFPEDAAWFPECYRELLAFPVGAHDDQVDALAYAAGVKLEGRRDLSEAFGRAAV